MRIRMISVGVGLLLASGCTDEGSRNAASDPSSLLELMERPEYRAACADVPGCAASRAPWSGASETIWRIQVIREASGGVRLGRIDSVEVLEGDGVPVGPLTGDYLLAGLDTSGRSVDRQLIAFSPSLRLEFEDLNTPPVEVELAGMPIDTVGYLRALPSIETLAVQDESGTTLASAAARPTVAATPAQRMPVFPELIAPAHAATGGATGLPAHCAHVIILDGERDQELAGFLPALQRFERDLRTRASADQDLAVLLHLASGTPIALETPGPYQLAAVLDGLARMTPLLCQGVGRVAFASFPLMSRYAAGAVLQTAGQGDLVMLNTASGFDEHNLARNKPERVFLTKTFIHEAGHAVEALLNASGNSPGLYRGAWPDISRRLAETTIDHVRLKKGFGAEWRRVHESFMAVGWASGYTESGLLTGSTGELSPSAVTGGGFMSRYGANIWWDDIADFVAMTYMSQDVVRQGWVNQFRLDLGCAGMQAHRERNVPAQLAAVYTKLLFLRDLGVVKAEDVANCTGMNLGLHIAAEGFHLWQDGRLLRSFTDDVHASIGTEQLLRNRVFEMSASGEAGFMGATYPATLRVRLDLGGTFDELDEVSWPRGVYELGVLSDNNVELRVEGAPAANFDARTGFVMVAEASNARIAGSIVLQRVFRLHAPLPVPETYDAPLVIRFMIEKE